MLTLDLMKSIDLAATPWGQIATASLLLVPDYNWPGRRTTIRVEGLEKIPETGRVILALNHTDRYNYWPLQYKLWRHSPSIYTATWVKGKYFNNPIIGKFMVATNNIPTPSKGYLLASDALKVLGEPPSSDLYRLLRDEFDAAERDRVALAERAEEAGLTEEIEQLLTTPRDILGHAFHPRHEGYFHALDALFGEMMEEFVRLNEQAFGYGHKIIVFPEGTRSLRLTKGRPGLAQMALRTGATVVPIGCNGSDELYPGDSPFSEGGEVTYRVGDPLTPKGALAPFAITEEYTPFTQEAMERHGETFRAMTDLLMERISELLDPRYRAGDTTEVTDAKRFL